MKHEYSHCHLILLEKLYHVHSFTYLPLLQALRWWYSRILLLSKIQQGNPAWSRLVPTPHSFTMVIDTQQGHSREETPKTCAYSHRDTLIPPSKPAALWAGLGFRGSAIPLEVGVKCLLLRGAWSRFALRDIQRFLLPIQHLVTTEHRIVRPIHGISTVDVRNFNRNYNCRTVSRLPSLEKPTRWAIILCLWWNVENSMLVQGQGGRGTNSRPAPNSQVCLEQRPYKAKKLKKTLQWMIWSTTAV